MKRSKFRAPRLISSWHIVQRALYEVQEALDSATRSPYEMGLRVSDFALQANTYVRLSPPAGGLQATLPPAGPDNAGESIWLNVENPTGSLVLHAAPNQVVDGASTATFSVAGLVLLVSNGVDAWNGIVELPTGVGGPVDAEFVLGAAHGSLPNGRVATASTHITPVLSTPNVITWDVNDGSIDDDALAPDVTWAAVLSRGNLTDIYPPNIQNYAPFNSYLSFGDEALLPVTGSIRAHGAFSVVCDDSVTIESGGTGDLALHTSNGMGFFTGVAIVNVLSGNLESESSGDTLLQATGGFGIFAGVTRANVATGNVQIESSGNISLDPALEFQVNAPGGIAIESLVTPSASVGANDIVVNTELGGVGVTVGPTPRTAIANGNFELLTSADQIFHTTGGGFNFQAGSTAPTAADNGDILFNAPSGGVSIVCGVTEVTGVLNGLFNVATSGVINLDAGDDVHLDGADQVQVTTGGTRRVNISSAGAWGFVNAFDFDVTGAATFDSTTDTLFNAQAEFVANGVAGAALTSCTALIGGIGSGDVIVAGRDGVRIEAGDDTPATAVTTGNLELIASAALNATASSLATVTGGTGGVLVTATSSGTNIELRPNSITDTVRIASVSGASRGLLDIREGSLPSTPDNGYVRLSARDLTPNVLTVTDDGGGQWPVNVHGFGFATGTTSSTATAGLSALSGSTTIPAGAWKVGTTFRFSGMLRYSRGATATACNYTIQILVAGTQRSNSGAIATNVTNGYVGTAWVEGYITCLSTGVAGTAMTAIRVLHTIPSTTLVLAVDSAASTFTLNTTASCTLDMDCIASAAVASLSRTWTAGSLMRVHG